ncbi:MAG: hypothetical protein QXI12_06655 [Candidatus Methanomethyliaceae archaeon]
MTEKVILLLERVVVTGMFLAFLLALILTGHLPQEWVSGVWGLIMLIAYAWFTVHTSQVQNAGEQVNNKKHAQTDNAAKTDNVVEKIIPPGMGGC